MDVGYCGFELVVSLSTVPVPSAARLYRLNTPVRFEREDDPLPFGCPDRQAVDARTEGQLPQRLAGEIPDPDVSALLIR